MLRRIWIAYRDSSWLPGVTCFLWIFVYYLRLIRNFTILIVYPESMEALSGFSVPFYPNRPVETVFGKLFAYPWEIILFILLGILGYVAWLQFTRHHYGRWLFHNLALWLCMALVIAWLPTWHYLVCTSIFTPEIQEFRQWVITHVPMWLLGL